ncbi:Uncharacterized protein clustered with Type I restriction-modification system [hydrothermal vent metagenome]|uniref:Uncharacterized protein clustered with Type I restriction-modification system n=1 Tax=hydrothermal vent metagenome TaxID=652676 RepID=A0A3B0YTI1_9ZZZZ
MKKLMHNSTAEFLIFTSQARDDSIEVRVEDESVWLTQKLMAELFGVDVRTVSEHLKNIIQSNELNADSVIRKFRRTASDGKSYSTQFYDLDVIISVGYRVNSKRATQFRQWATQVLSEFAIHGQTAAELIKEHANSKKANMGLSGWGKAPDGKVVKADVAIAKNYLQKDELESLGRIVSAYLDLGEDRAKRKIPMSMKDWAKHLNLFLEFDERDILQGSGKITAKIARDYANT